jgi:hypothetical protein
MKGKIVLAIDHKRVSRITALLINLTAYMAIMTWVL